VALGLICTGALAQTTLKEAVAPGNKVYVQIVNDDDHPIPQDEIEDVCISTVIEKGFQKDLFKKAGR